MSTPDMTTAMDQGDTWLRDMQTITDLARTDLAHTQRQGTDMDQGHTWRPGTATDMGQGHTWRPGTVTDMGRVRT